MSTSGADERLARQVLRIRIGQLLVNDGLRRGDFRVPLHLALGHEGIAAAVDQVMQDGDQLLLSHRNIHYNLARCDDFAAEYREYLLQGDGLAGGTLGSMNLSNPARGVPYSSSILGNNLPVAAGSALGGRLLADGGVTFVVTGDGAMEEGAFYESLVLMKSFDLPAVVVVENNGWSLATEIAERRCPIDLRQLTAAVGIPYAEVAGSDPFACAATLAAARAQAAAGAPQLLEVPLTTLGYWHVDDPRYPETGRFINYHHGAAPEAELADWPQLAADGSDPLQVLSERLPAAILADWAGQLRGELGAAIA